MAAFVFDSRLAQETVEKLIGCLLVSDDSTFTKFLLLKIFGLVGDDQIISRASSTCPKCCDDEDYKT